MENSEIIRKKIMQEALDLQTQWERALAQLSKGRQYDDLTLEEQQEWQRISVGFNEQIDKKFEELGVI